jgi:putative phosphonate metabolism protein
VTARYAIYFAPAADSALWRFGCRWLGRDPDSGEAFDPVPLPEFSRERHRAITASPRHYGFHATLKAPIALAAVRSETELLAMAEAFTRDRRPFEAPPPVLRSLGGFLALVPCGDAPELSDLAADCVRAFDPFRAPPSPAELERRRSGGLSNRHAELLERWGYPYVFEEFRFHMTLTENLSEPERSRVKAGLEPMVRDFGRWPLLIDGIAVFKQDRRDDPFHILARFPLALLADIVDAPCPG